MSTSVDIITKLKKPNFKKIDICSGSFTTETACNLQFKLKVTKSNLLAFLKHDQKRV